MRKPPAKMPSRTEVQLGFGAAVRQFRTARGLTQEDLAGTSELHVTYVSQVERGLRNVTLYNIHRLAHALEVAPSMLVEAGTT
jgi:transcriptional regulator with XRE-family HTH domain